MGSACGGGPVATPSLRLLTNYAAGGRWRVTCIARDVGRWSADGMRRSTSMAPYCRMLLMKSTGPRCRRRGDGRKKEEKINPERTPPCACVPSPHGHPPSLRRRVKTKPNLKIPVREQGGRRWGGRTGGLRRQSPGVADRLREPVGRSSGNLFFVRQKDHGWGTWGLCHHAGVAWCTNLVRSRRREEAYDDG